MSERDASFIVRPIDAGAPSEVELVATRMRATLVEVLGRARGEAMYPMDWLADRVRFHLDPARSTGQVFLAEDAGGAIVGHTIVRIEREESGRTIGLFSTTYVVPGHRRAGVASLLLDRGETWMREHRLAFAVTYTDEANTRLIELFAKRGYRIAPAAPQMVKLEKSFDVGRRQT